MRRRGWNGEKVKARERGGKKRRAVKRRAEELRGMCRVDKHGNVWRGVDRKSND